jgi:hypothetical protein
LSIAGSVAKTTADRPIPGIRYIKCGLSPRWTRGRKMADQDMKAAEQTYTGFLALTKWGTILSAAAAVLVVILIA